MNLVHHGWNASMRVTPFRRKAGSSPWRRKEASRQVDGGVSSAPAQATRRERRRAGALRREAARAPAEGCEIAHGLPDGVGSGGEANVAAGEEGQGPAIDGDVLRRLRAGRYKRGWARAVGAGGLCFASDGAGGAVAW